MHKAIPVLFEDDCFVVFEKPSGTLTIPTPRGEKNTLDRIVNEELPKDKEREYHLHPCHRLDRETSGAIIFAKGKKNQQSMMNLFKHKGVKKKYVALVQGRMKRLVGEIKSAIKDFSDNRFRREARGKLAITRFKVIEVRHTYSIVEVSPLTGRTNQVRIHFSEIGHPLLGERQYAFGKDYALKFRRIALHASEIEWMHPLTHRPVKIVSELPADMENFIRLH